MKKTIYFEWIEGGKYHKKVVNREELFDIMNSIKKGFESNNEISTLLCQSIPEVAKIFINKDRNAQMDTPFIAVVSEEGERKVISILRHHKIIWALLDGYCTD